MAQNNHDLPFAKELFEAADRLRGSVESAEYKHLVLGLLFLKYISDSFERRRAWLDEATLDAANADYFTEDDSVRAEILEDRDEYISENVFWVPEEARWPSLLAAASRPNIGERIDKALDAIERDNSEQLRGVLPKIYARAPIQPAKLGELVGTIAKIGFGDDPERARDVLGRTYEYFIREFARKEGHRGGEYYTPRSVTRLLVEMLEPYKGRVLDPACGSGGLFVQSAEFVQAHGGRAREISILGQENNQATWRICRMNLAIHGLSGDVTLGDSLLDDKFAGARADFVMANPPFNMKKWGAASLAKDARWTYGEPPDANANYAWIQHFIHHLTPDGRAGFVMANGSLTSTTNGEDQIRRRIVDEDLVDCLVALPAQLFFTTGIAVCLWFIDRNKASGSERDRRGEVLFIDARSMGHKISRTQIEFTDIEIERIASTYRAWRGESADGAYSDQPGFCRVVTRGEIEGAGYLLAPGHFVDHETPEDEAAEPLQERLARLIERADDEGAQLARLAASVRGVVAALGTGEDVAVDGVGWAASVAFSHGLRHTLAKLLEDVFTSWFVAFEPVIARQEGSAPANLAPDVARLFPDSFSDDGEDPLPSGWRMASVYDIAEVIYGAPFASARFNEEGRGLPLLRIRDLGTHAPTVFTDEEHPKGEVVRFGDIVIGMDGEFRVHRWRGPDSYLNQRVCKVVPRDGVPPAFVQLSLQRPLAFFERSKTGTTVIHLLKRDIDTIRVVRPDGEVLSAFGRIAEPLAQAVLQIR